MRGLWLFVSLSVISSWLVLDAQLVDQSWQGVFGAAMAATNLMIGLRVCQLIISARE